MKLITHAAVALLGTALSSTAFAGCGKESRFNFAPMSVGAKAAARYTPNAAPDGAQPSKDNVTGLWLSTVNVGGNAAFQSFEAFTSDGLEFLNDNGSPLAGNVCFGVWTVQGKTLKVYHPAWNYDDAGNLTGTVTITSFLTINADGNTFKGTVVVEAFDLNGQSLGVVLQGSVTGRKITG